MHAQRLNLAIRLAAAIALVWTVGGSQAVHAQALTNTGNAAAPHGMAPSRSAAAPSTISTGVPRGRHSSSCTRSVIRRTTTITWRRCSTSDTASSPSTCAGTVIPTGRRRASTAEDYVSDLHALVTQLKLGPVTLIGCSIGGRVVQVYAGMYPDRVSKLIVLDVGPARPESTTRTLSDRIEREQQGWASEDELFASLRRNPTRVPEEVHRNQVRYEQAAAERPRRVEVRPESGERARADRALGLRQEDQGADALRDRRPQPPGHPRGQSQLKTLPFAEVVTIPEAGHYPQEDTPELFLAVVKAFLAG